MKIFFPNASIAFPPASGGDVHRYQLIKNLVELGHEVITLEPDKNPHTSTRPKRLLPVWRAIRSADIIYCRLEEEPNAATRLTAKTRSWLIPRRTPVVWELNVSLTGAATLEARPATEVERHVAALRDQAERVDAVIGVTEALTHQARDLLGVRQVFVIQNASDPQMFRRDLEPPQTAASADHRRLQVVTIGSNPNAYHDVEILHVLGRLIDERQLPIDIHVFGKSQQLFDDHVPAAIQLRGPISYLDMPAQLAAMDVGLALYNIPLDHNSPLKLFDYLASGCVPICSEGQPVREVLGGTQAGLVGHWSAASLADTLLNLHQNRPHLEVMRKAGRNLVETEYNWRRVAERTVQILADLQAHRGRPGRSPASATERAT